MASSILDQIRAAEQRFGKGETYSSEERHLILERVVPEFVFRGARFGDGETKKRCEKAIEALKELHRRVVVEIPVGAEDARRE